MATKPRATRSATLKAAAKQLDNGTIALIDAYDEVSGVVFTAAGRVSASAATLRALTAPITDDDATDAKS